MNNSSIPSFVSKSSVKKSKLFLEKWLVHWLGQGKYKVRLNHPVPGDDSVLKEWSLSEGHSQSEDISGGQILDSLIIK